MTEAALRTWIGLFLVLSHFGIIMLVIGFYFRKGFLFDEMTTSVALILPMFVSYTTVIINYVINQRLASQTTLTLLSGSYVFLSWFFPVLFVSYLVVIIFMKAFNKGIANFEQFKVLLGLGETLFALYIAKFIASLYGQSLAL
jgi:hypothetical protein